MAKWEWRRTKAAGRFLWGSGRLISKGNTILIAMVGSGLVAIGWVFTPSTTRSIVRHGGTTVISFTNTPHWPFALVGIVVAFTLVFLIHGVQLERRLENQSQEHRSDMQRQQDLLERERQAPQPVQALNFFGDVYINGVPGASGASVAAQPSATGLRALSGTGSTGSSGFGTLSVVPDTTMLSPNNQGGKSADQ